jgi:F-type H+-transporting ATPase subunit a
VEITPDDIVYWEWRFVTLNATLVFSWAVMALLALGSWLITRNLETGPRVPRWQNGLEIIVDTIQRQIAEASGGRPDRYLPFVGTLFLFIVVANVLDAVPGFRAPTASLTTTAALATCVFVAVPVFGIARQGVKDYFRQYVRPTPLMLPFHVIGELSRTLALAVRLFGNITSGSLIVAIVLSIAPLFFPVVMQALGLLIGVIQAYVFAILALVYVASAERAHRPSDAAESA